MAQCYCGTVLMTTPEEPEQDVSSHSTIEGGEVSAFRLAGPRLKIECIVNPALMQFAIGNSPKVIYVILQANTPTLHGISKFGPEYWAVNLCEGSYVA